MYRYLAAVLERTQNIPDSEERWIAMIVGRAYKESLVVLDDARSMLTMLDCELEVTVHGGVIGRQDVELLVINDNLENGMRGVQARPHGKLRLHGLKRGIVSKPKGFDIIRPVR
nr:hypothetical protein [Neorhizobium tomejilense]